VTEIFDAAMAYETTGIQSRDSQPPSSFVLEQNFPNPFNAATTIQFSLPHPGKASLTVFDVNGKEVARLIDTDMTANHHHIRFDASRLASGVYCYRLQSGDFVATRKFLLIK